MTDSDIAFIINELRRASVKWDGRSKCLEFAKVRIQEGFYKNGKPRYKNHWKCAKCEKLFREESMLQVDHIEEVGPYQGDLHKFCIRLFCGQENLQVLCTLCHTRKTSTYNATLRFERKR